MSFRKRLGLFLIVALVSIQSLTAFSAYIYLRQGLLSRAKLELSGATHVFARQLDFLSERVADSVQVLSLDFALRTAIARRDMGTQLSALRNHGDRIGATRMMIAGLDGRITADTSSSAANGRFRYPSLLSAALLNGQGAGLVSEGGNVYWVVAVPLRAPIPIAYIAAFIPIQDALLRKMQTMSSSHQSISLLTRAANGGWRVAAGTGGHGQPIAAISSTSTGGGSSLVQENGQEYLRYLAPLDVSPGSATIVAMLQYPLNDALAAYRGVVLPMIAVLAIGLLAMLLGAALVARSLSRPLEALAVVARRIAIGDYRPLPHSGRTDEIGDLAEALTAMTASIAEREEGLRHAIRAAEEAKNEAVSVNRAKSDFLSNMSHELRTPLNAILGFSELIGTEALGPVGVRKYADYANDVHRAGKHLLRHVERILTLSDAEAGRLVLDRKVFRADEPILGAIETVEAFGVQAKVSLLVECPSEWPQLSGEPEELRAAISNILHNAIRFTPSGGNVRLRAVVEARRIIVEIGDTGIGIDAETLAFVTKPFYRLRSAFDGTNQGAGIGLAYAKAIVESHCGTLQIASRPGKGTTVTISLPFAATEEVAA